MRALVRIYDDTADAPQPAGPVAVDLPDGATDAEAAQEIRRLFVDPSRTATVERRGGPVNEGWAVLYGREVAVYTHLAKRHDR